jgi:type I restriction enzyme R subunit
MSKLSEKNGVEVPIYEWLGKMGWQCRTSDELKGYGRQFSNPIIESILVDRISHINSVGPDAAKRAVDILRSTLDRPSVIEANEQFLNLLCEGVTLTIDGKDRTLKIIDFENVWNNDFTVTRQFWVQGVELVKPDLVCLINGIPLVPSEAKQRAQQSSDWMKGVRDLSLYETKVPRLWACHLFAVACNGRMAKYGVPGASSQYFAEWRDLSVHDTPCNPLANAPADFCTVKTDQDGRMMAEIPDWKKMMQTVVGLLQPSRVLDILRHGVVFERTVDKGTVKKIARYQQQRAAEKISARVEEALERKDERAGQGVVWQTQGSGKSLTMVFTAFKLRGNPKLGDPTVYIVVDRKDLRTQLGDTFDLCLFPNTVRPISIPALREKVKARPSEVIITTIQKFRDLQKDPDFKPDDRNNVIVLIDEAHRTQYGSLNSELQAAFPEAKFFAFTGTPIPKTHRTFGALKDGTLEAYLDRYSIKDAIDDKATVEVRYAFGPQEMWLDKEKLKQGWAEITDELNEEQKQAVQKRVQPWKEFLKDKDRIERLAQDIAEDFRSNVEPSGFKAQVVTADKEACHLYYQALLKHFQPEEMAVVISETTKASGEETYNKLKDYNLGEGQLKEIIRRFKRRISDAEVKAGNELKILIVCNMLLTGFDAPIEQTMYLDSPLRDHNLLQAIARTNRTYEDKATGTEKRFGRVVDYVGVFSNYVEALNYEPEDIPDFQTVDALADTFPELIQIAMKPFEGIKLEDSYECSTEIVRRLGHIDQLQFEKDFRDVVQTYEALSPHPLLVRPDVADRYDWLITIFRIYLSEFKRPDFDAEFFAAKTRKLIRDSARMTNFIGHLPEIAIDARYLENLRFSKLSESDKLEKILRDIETVIRDRVADNPAYIELDEKLQEIVERKNKETMDLADLLRDTEALYQQLDDVANEPVRMGFADRGRYDLFLDLKHATAELFDENSARRFVETLVGGLQQKRFRAGWHESVLEVNAIRTELKVLGDDPDFESMAISDNKDLVEKLINRLEQHYACG